MSNPELTPGRFRVSEWADGSPYLSLLEGAPRTNTVLNDRHQLAIHLKDGTTMQEAEELVRHMNKYVTQLGITFLP
jgi:hypothetical protein